MEANTDEITEEVAAAEALPNEEIEASHEKDVDKNEDCYLNRGEFTSELFKLELKNLPKNFGFGVRPFFSLF